MKKYLSILFLIILIVPSVALASWWNPFSWKIFQKKDITLQSQVETQKTSDEKIKELEKELDYLKDEKLDSTITTKTSISKQKEGEISTSDLFKVIDNLIDNYNSSINSYTEIQDFVNTRINTISELKEKMLFVLKIETDSCSKEWDEWVLKVLDKEEKYQKSVADNNSQMIKLSENQIDGLKKLRNITPDYMGEETFLISYDKLKALYGDIDRFKEDILTTNKNQRMVIEKSLSMWEQWKTNTNSCSSQYTANYNTIRTYNYQPAIIPQIQIPKTTYCTMGLMSGTRSYYSITCN